MKGTAPSKDDDLSLSPKTSRVAHLTLVIGAGSMGIRITDEMERLLADAGQGPALSVRVCRIAPPIDLEQELGRLISTGNLERLEQLGYEIPGRQVGEPLRIHSIIAVDCTDAPKDQVEQVFARLRELSPQSSTMALLTGLPRIEDLLSHPIVRDLAWDWVLPAPTNDPATGLRAPADIVATLCRMAFLLTTSNENRFGASFLPGEPAGARGPAVVRIGGAFLEASASSLPECLSNPVAGALLEQQYQQIKPHEPPAAFDDRERTRVLDMLNPELLAQRLFAGTPFLLAFEKGAPWRIALPRGVITAEIESTARRRWVAVLSKHRDLFDFAKAGRWTESMESAEKELVESLEAQSAEDVRQLHFYERGADRVLAWSRRARTILEKQPDIAPAASRDFEAALEVLKNRIAQAPRALPVLARAALLGWLGAEALRRLAFHYFNPVAGWAAFGLVFLAAALLAFRLLERAHRSLYAALGAAQEALVSRYENQARENLVLILTRVRSRLIADFDREARIAEQQARAALHFAGEMKENFGTPDDPELVNVERVIPFQLRKELLESLKISWPVLSGSAAGEGAMAPAPTEGPDCMRLTAEGLRAFAQNYLSSLVGDLGLEGLITFRDSKEPGFSRRIVGDLDRRARSQVPGAIQKTIWAGSTNNLARFREQIESLGARYEELPVGTGILACFKIGVHTPGGGAE